MGKRIAERPYLILFPHLFPLVVIPSDLEVLSSMIRLKLVRNRTEKRMRGKNRDIPKLLCSSAFSLPPRDQLNFISL